MISILKYDVVIVKFPFASSLKYKARPAVVISSAMYNDYSRDTFLIVAISSNIKHKLDFEEEVVDWKTSGLLKPSIFKSAVATIEKSHVLTKIGTLSDIDTCGLDKMLQDIC